MTPEQIRTLRQRLGLTQAAMARSLGVATYTWQRWEAGLTRPLPVFRAKLEEMAATGGND